MANKNRNKLIILPALGLAALSSAVVLGATPESFAETKTGTSTVTVNIGSVLSLSVPTSIAVNIAAPTSDGVFASGTGTVGVTTNNAAGYSVYLTSNSSSTTLDHATNTSAKISSITAAQTINTSTTKFSTNNTWGWSSDGSSFKPVAASGTANGSSTLFKQTSSPATSQENSTLTIGVTADTSLVAGSYSGVIKLTAITN